MRGLLTKFVGDTRGQDLVEYALLTVFVAIVGALAFNSLESSMGTAYEAWDTNEQYLWEPADPPPAATP